MGEGPKQVPLCSTSHAGPTSIGALPRSSHPGALLLATGISHSVRHGIRGHSPALASPRPRRLCPPTGRQCRDVSCQGVPLPDLDADTPEKHREHSQLRLEVTFFRTREAYLRQPSRGFGRFGSCSARNLPPIRKEQHRVPAEKGSPTMPLSVGAVGGLSRSASFLQGNATAASGRDVGVGRSLAPRPTMP